MEINQEYMQPSESLNSMDFCYNFSNEIYDDENLKNSRSERRLKAKSRSSRKIKRKSIEQGKTMMSQYTNSFNQHISIFNPDNQVGMKSFELKKESETLMSKSKEALSLTSIPLSSLSFHDNELTSLNLSSSYDVPKERVDFYKKFSMLINLGIDYKNKSWERQLSNEEEEWRGEFKDCLWLQLNAFLSTKSMQEFEESIRLQRQSINDDLNDIMNFKLEKSCENFLLEPEVDFIQSKFNHSLSCSMHGIRQDLFIIEKAAYDVISILNTLDSVEALYPTLKSIIKGNNLYASQPFQIKIESLYMWINLTFEQLIKIKTIIKLMELPNKKISPEFGVSLSLIEKILSKYYTYYRNEKMIAINGSNVTSHMESVSSSPNTFNGSPFLLTPNTNLEASFKSKLSTTSRQTSVTEKKLSVSGSSGSFDINLLMPRNDSCTTSVYRAYVDHMLKKIGIKKLCTRMYIVLKDTLQRSKLALLYSENFSSDSISQYSAHTQQFVECGLPSFLPIFVFLARIPLDVVHECLLLRLEQKPINPPFDVLRQLLEECRDVLYAAVDVKQYYLDLIEGVKDANYIDMDTFENNLQKMLDVYFEYLKLWMESLQHCPEMSKKMKNFLEEEWSFTKKICPYINGGEAGAAKNFCILLSCLLQSISDFVDNGVDECTKNLVMQNSACDYKQNIDSNSDNTDNENNIFEKSDDDNDISLSGCIKQSGLDLNRLFNEARERSFKAIAFARLLRKDLELAAEYKLIKPLDEFYTILSETKHIKLKISESTNCDIFVPEYISNDHKRINQLMNITTGSGEYWLEDSEFSNSDYMTKESYMIFVHLEGKDLIKWADREESVRLDIVANIAFAHIHIENITLVALHSLNLIKCRMEFEKLFRPYIHLLIDQMSCHCTNAESLNELKEQVMDLRHKIMDGVDVVEKRLQGNDIMLKISNDEAMLKTVTETYRKTMHQCFNYAFEYHKEICRLISGTMIIKLSGLMIDCAKQWMRFAKKQDKGHGIRPRWSNHGFDFLKWVCDPKYIVHQTNDEFKEFTQEIDACLTYIIGCKSSPNNQLNTRISSVSSHISDLTNKPKTKFKPSLSTQILDKDREEMLITSKVIGNVTQRPKDVNGKFQSRSFKFRWQRGFKIGQGSFGKVYKALDIDNNISMAIKVIPILPNKKEVIKEIQREITLFDGLKHPRIVEYYGLEQYVDEIIIFMEYCQNGTLETVAKLGLSDLSVRLYTKQILEGLTVIHNQGIVHRDLKGANIFLSQDGDIKLGDFGLSIQMERFAATSINGKLRGTLAFMAPEAMRGDIVNGLEIKLDIWSLGCVVIQMYTGKLPWHEFENHDQVALIFKVGDGKIPKLPENISKEAFEFLTKCFDVVAESRPSAEQLMDHLFVKIQADD